MVNTRSQWRVKLAEALKHLGAFGTPVAQFTRKVILGEIRVGNKEKLRIAPMQEITHDDFKEISESLISSPKRKKMKLVYPPHPDDIEILEEEIVGVIRNSNVYVSKEALEEPKLLCRTLVHEINHYVNKSNDVMKPEKRLEEELRAYLAEELAVSNKRITRYFLRKTAQEIAKGYEYPMPGKVKMPDGVYTLEDWNATKVEKTTRQRARA